MALPKSITPMRLQSIQFAARDINLFEFVSLHGESLPPFSAGAHIDLYLPNGMVRQYSLCNSEQDRHRYIVGVKRDGQGRGGSQFMHENLRVGSVLEVGAPRNNFALAEDSPNTVLIAGGIGITPMVPMVARLRQIARPWQLYYSVRERPDAAFLGTLAGPHVHLHVDAEHDNQPLSLVEIVRNASAGSHLYCCGPAPMLDSFEAATAGRPPTQIHVERFMPSQAAANTGGFTVKLSRRGDSIQVAPGQTILEALRSIGVVVPTSCEQGICGTCETHVLQGAPDHRDALLSDEEKQSGKVMMICCSGSKGDLLVLDL